MAKIKKIQEAGRTIYPATILQGIKDAESGKALGEVMARKTGNYPELTAGFAENIVGDGSSTPEVISFRPTAGENRNTLNEGAARIAKLKGNSVVWNQLGKIKTYNIVEQEINGIKMTIEGDYLVFNGTATDSAVFELFGVSEVIENHKYLFKGSTNYVDGKWGTYCLYLPNDVWKSPNFKGQPFIGEAAITANNPAVLFTVWKGVTVSNIRINKNFGFHDLTQMFGAGNEPTTVEQFYSMLPVGVDLTAYNAGEIVDGNYKAIKTTGFNQWDEQWVNGYVNEAGNKITDTNNSVSLNPIKTLPNLTYCYHGPQGVVICFYDASGKIIGERLTVAANSTFTTPANCMSFDFFIVLPSMPTDICFNLSWPEYTSLNGTYQPYKPFERDLSWVAKYFPNGMRSAGNVADEIRFNSTTQKWEAVVRVGVVDLGSLNWSIQSNEVFLVPVSNKKLGSLQTTSEFANNTKESFYFSSVSNNNKDTLYCNSGNVYIYIVSSTHTDVKAFKAAMQGVMLNYELATPIVTEIEENVNFDFDVSDYGTEELLVAEGAQSAPLAADIVYAPNALSTIKNVPDIFTRLAALEAALATMQASAVATTNEE